MINKKINIKKAFIIDFCFILFNLVHFLAGSIIVEQESFLTTDIWIQSL